MKKSISIVVPVYNEEKNIHSFYSNYQQMVTSLLEKYDFELIFVDDGSRDKTYFKILQVCEKDPRVKWISLSRNFWKEISLTAWIEWAKGDAIITLDGDGQHPIEKFPLFLEQWEKWFEIVYHKRKTMTGAPFIKKLSSQLFYKLFNLVSEFKMEEGTTDYRLLDKKVVHYFLMFTEKNRSYRWLTDWMGFRKKALLFDVHEREKWQKATYNYRKLFKLAMNSITSFSLFPLKLVWYLGIFITFASSFLAVFIICDKFFLWNHYAFTNISVVIVFNTWIMWVVLMSLGLIALYIANIHEEVLRRPIYIVKDKINF